MKRRKLINIKPVIIIPLVCLQKSGGNLHHVANMRCSRKIATKIRTNSRLSISNTM